MSVGLAGLEQDRPTPWSTPGTDVSEMGCRSSLPLVRFLSLCPRDGEKYTAMTLVLLLGRLEHLEHSEHSMIVVVDDGFGQPPFLISPTDSVLLRRPQVLHTHMDRLPGCSPETPGNTIRKILLGRRTDTGRTLQSRKAYLYLGTVGCLRTSTASGW